MKLRRLVKQLLLVVFATFGFNVLVGSSVAVASCGDYLEHSSSDDQTSGVSAIHVVAALRLPWYLVKPCDGPGCKQSSPNRISPPSIPALSRQQISPLSLESSVMVYRQEGVCYSVLGTDGIVDSAYGPSIFRPPATFESDYAIASSLSL